jgi:hypothetical protein
MPLATLKLSQPARAHAILDAAGVKPDAGVVDPE